MPSHVPMAAAALFAAVALSVAHAGPAADRAEVEKAYREAWARPDDEAAIARLEAALPRFEGYFVVEGDILMTGAQLRRYALEKSMGQQLAAPGGGELIVNTASGVPTYWMRSQRALRYAVEKSSFADEARYLTVVENMARAASDWERACSSCGLTLAHAPEHDGAPSHGLVTFIVRGVDAGGSFIAAAFFPNDAPARRYLNVDPSYFSTSFDRTGVFRHELGHVLGYRHEHIRDVSGCYSEGPNWLPLTRYDPRSVMHYVCGGAGSPSLRLTRTDKRGHRALYSAP